MLSRKEIQLDLLRKLNELCEEANVKYALHDRAAILAYKGEPINHIASMKVMMCQGDAEKIADILDDDRYYFEDFRSNPKFDRHFMMFGYKDSLDLKSLDLNFKTDRHIENHCIRINISFINHQIPKGTGKKLVAEKKQWEFRHMELHSPKFWRCILRQKKINLKSFLKGNKKINKERYETKKKHYAIDTWENIQKYPYVRVSGKKFKSDIFNELTPANLEGVPTYILKDFDTYARILYGKDWKAKGFKLAKSFESSTMSWEEFSKNPKVKKSLAIIQRNYEDMYFERMELKKYKESTNQIAKHVLQSANVFNTRQNLIDEKERIIELYDSGDFDKLGDLFDPLIESEKESILLGYSFSVDEDIDIIFDEYLRENGNVKLANKIDRLKADI